MSVNPAIIMVGIDRQGVVGLNGSVGQHAYVYYYVPVRQNKWRSKNCVGQHYISQSILHPPNKPECLSLTGLSRLV